MSFPLSPLFLQGKRGSSSVFLDPFMTTSPAADCREGDLVIVVNKKDQGGSPPGLPNVPSGFTSIMAISASGGSPTTYYLTMRMSYGIIGASGFPAVPNDFVRAFVLRPAKPTAAPLAVASIAPGTVDLSGYAKPIAAFSCSMQKNSLVAASTLSGGSGDLNLSYAQAYSGLSIKYRMQFFVGGAAYTLDPATYTLSEGTPDVIFGSPQGYVETFAVHNAA
ncbi:hypothetical protein [Thioclava sp. DLFJ4-1]|uniref:hypothetical protein n=1 Tax=Thioclava sp. DLFJ4-1 TaxID=1915313 RepID=UPI00099830B8|nr:hypothetical protein [Thioclava sp. DLFJ4-1]OOY16710.1 hypothetical protein BMI85_06495 [Thioclava sp. DLFJ4-1]